MLTTLTTSKSQRFQLCAFCFLAGIAWGSLGNKAVDVSAILLSTMLAALAFWKSLYLRLLLVCLGLFIGGFWYARQVYAHVPHHISHLNGQTVNFEARIDAEPDIRQDGVRYILKAERAGEADLSGRVFYKSFLYPRYEYGTKMVIRCSLKEPEPIETFRYDKYLANQGVFSICQRGSVLSVEESHISAFGLLLRSKSWVAQKVNTLWHEPHAGFMAGLLYGYRGGLGSLDEAFSITGLTHIVAISGYNITMVGGILIAVCTRLWIPKQKSIFLILFGIFVFVLFAGASASVVRAGIMGALVLIARHLGRPQAAGGILLLAAVIMAMFRPLSLVWDAGFQLSFLATIGLVYLTPIIERYTQWIPERFTLRESASTTIAAIIITQPLVLYQFEKMSLVAPFANMLVLFMIPIAMFIGMAAVAVSSIIPALGLLIAHAALLAMSYITFWTNILAEVPHASLNVGMPLWAMIACYSMLGIWIFEQTKT